MTGVTIPKGATLVLLFASGSRDPARFVEPDRFDPDRTDNQHLGFGGGIHYCVESTSARLETHIALSTLLSRLVAPRLVTDPPPYRKNASLRGPQHLMIALITLRVDDDTFDTAEGDHLIKSTLLLLFVLLYRRNL